MDNRFGPFNAEKVRNDIGKITGNDYATKDYDKIHSYLYDESFPLTYPKISENCVLAKPGSPAEIAEILKYAGENRIPVVPRGGGTGVVGGAMPAYPGIILSLERLNRVLEIDEKNLMMTLEGGATLSALLEALEKQGKLFFPIPPGDEGAEVGGMVATNAGGTRAVKHGIMRNHIKALEVVLPTGEIVSLGGKLLKNNMGYDLMQLMIGSEGTLGVITKVTLRLYAKNEFSNTMLVSFLSQEEASDAVPQILQSGITPLACEYMDRELTLASAEELGFSWPAKKGSVDLMFIVDGVSEDDLYGNCEKIVEICEQWGAVDSVVAETPKEQKEILAVRSNCYTPYKSLVADITDVAVPPSAVPAFFEDVRKIGEKYGNRIVSLGHIADGNMHNFLMNKCGRLPENYEELKTEIYKTAIKFGGTITAEHGTGKTRKDFMNLQFSDKEIDLMKAIKKAFDPEGILNPGTIFD